VRAEQYEFRKVGKGPFLTSAPGRGAKNLMLPYNARTENYMPRFSILPVLVAFLIACTPASAPSAEVQIPDSGDITGGFPAGFIAADGSRPLNLPADFGAHEDFRTEWWYYTGNLQTAEQRHFGFELTVFRVGLLPPAVTLPNDSYWYGRSVYFAHFAVSDIDGKHFYAFERYSRPGPGLAGAQADPYRVWLEDWNITERVPGVYSLQAAQDNIALELTLTDELGAVLHGAGGYSRKGKNIANASYYYSQPRLRAEGFVEMGSTRHPVRGLAWKDHEFSSGALGEDQVGWDWFSLQFEAGAALMLFQLRERGGGISDYSSGTFIAPNGTPQSLQNRDFEIIALSQWRSPHSGGTYPSAWEIRLKDRTCRLEIQPWMADQEINFPAVTYWEGAVRFAGTCGGAPVRGNGYVELTGYAGNLPLR